MEEIIGLKSYSDSRKDGKIYVPKPEEAEDIKEAIEYIIKREHLEGSVKWTKLLKEVEEKWL